MSGNKTSSAKFSSTTAIKKPYHFFTLPNICLLEGELTKISENSTKILFFTLHEDSILFYSVFYWKNRVFLIKPQEKSKKKFLGGVHFDFELKVQWILKISREKQQKTHKLLGFKFVAGDYFEHYESKDEILLHEIKEILKRKLNQMNFHDYFKAIRKLGRGNFASVRKKPENY